MPMLTGRPSMRKRWAQLRETRPVMEGFTSSDRPKLPRPSPYRPGVLMVWTKAAERRLGRCKGTTFVITFFERLSDTG